MRDSGRRAAQANGIGGAPCFVFSSEQSTTGQKIPVQDARHVCAMKVVSHVDDFRTDIIECPWRDPIPCVAGHHMGTRESGARTSSMSWSERSRPNGTMVRPRWSVRRSTHPRASRWRGHLYTIGLVTVRRTRPMDIAGSTPRISAMRYRTLRVSIALVMCVVTALLPGAGSNSVREAAAVGLPTLIYVSNGHLWIRPVESGYAQQVGTAWAMRAANGLSDPAVQWSPGGPAHCL